ncbi:MAG TPA: SpoIIE family protein phosphatase [Blastocatellia bacterium]|nr:SpoIIE family protein phosphatase [Blastocatellia bacterium]
MTGRLKFIAGILFFALMFFHVGANAHRTYLSERFYHGWWWTVEDRHLVVTGTDPNGPAKALRDGDRVVAINGEQNLLLIIYQIQGHIIKPGDAYTMVVRRDGQELEFTLRPIPRKVGQIAFALLIQLLIRLSFLLTGFAVFLLKPHDKQALLLALMLGTYSSLSYFGYGELPFLLRLLAALAGVLGLFFPPLFFHFFLIFPEASPLVRRFPRLERYLYLPFLLTTVPTWCLVRLLVAVAPEKIKAVPPLNWVNYSVLIGYIVAGLVSLVVNYRQAGRMSRRKLRVVAFGGGLGFLTFLVLLLSEALKLDRSKVFWQWLDNIAPFMLTLAPLSFAYAIIRHQVIPISLIIRRGVRYVFVSRGSVVLELAAVVVILTVVLNAIFSRLQPPGIVIGIISGAVSIVVWNRTKWLHHRFLAPVIDRRFFRQSYDSQRILAELGQSLRTTAGLPELLEQVATKIQSALQTENVTVFLRDEVTGDYFSEHGIDYCEAEGGIVRSSERLRLPRDAGTVGRLEQTAAPLEVDLKDPDSPLFAPGSNGSRSVERETLAALRSSLLLPLATRDRMPGIISLGPRLGDLPYSGEDEQLLMSVAGPATFAVENARLVERMVEEARRRQELEALNEQRARELEEARQLQLSMLPKTVPQLPDLEVAAYMKTAAEVGGDYYDFHLADDGALTIAVGDATGHGLKAGTVVTATKSLFNNLAAAPDLIWIFQQSSSALKRMNLRALYMAITMLRLRGRQLTVCSAGMPPVLIYHARTRAVEEVMLRGMPLGSVMSYPWRQQEVSLADGDIVLVMSDGFPERFNHAREMLDDAPAREVLAAAAHQSPQEIINRLVRVGDEWGGARPQDDDITFVVLKVKDQSPARSSDPEINL